MYIKITKLGSFASLKNNHYIKQVNKITKNIHVPVIGKIPIPLPRQKELCLINYQVMTSGSIILVTVPFIWVTRERHTWDTCWITSGIINDVIFWTVTSDVTSFLDCNFVRYFLLNVDVILLKFWSYRVTSDTVVCILLVTSLYPLNATSSSKFWYHPQNMWHHRITSDIKPQFATE